MSPTVGAFVARAAVASPRAVPVGETQPTTVRKPIRELVRESIRESIRDPVTLAPSR